MKKVWRSALLSGFLLYLVVDISICLNCLNMGESVFSATWTTALVLGAMITLVLFLYHRTSLKQQLLAGVIFQIVFWLLFIFDSLAGITRNFVTFPDDEYSLGLLIIFFWADVTLTSVITFICTAAAKLIKKMIVFK